MIALDVYAAYRWYILLIGPSVVSYWTVLRLTFLSVVAGMVVPKSSASKRSRSSA